MFGLPRPELTAGQERAWRTQIRANFFIDDPLPALQAETHRRFEPAPGVVAEAVTYTSQFGMRVPAILYLPQPLPKGGRIPGFIVVNGHGGDKYSWYAFYAGVLYARGGAAVLTFDRRAKANAMRRAGPAPARTTGSRAASNSRGGWRGC
ncbi:MAG: hypothetical protein M3463_20940 [Verrucomicrobiota bacterium]|nr:hypothetical protein [Verrucomicrobiota bacterium]